MDQENARRRLLQRREQLEQRLDRIRRDRRRRADPLSPDFADQAIQRENDETLDALDGRVREELAQIDAALGRVEDATYGLCATCGDAIAPARLETLPAATTCSRCAVADTTAAMEEGHDA